MSEKLGSSACDRKPIARICSSVLALSVFGLAAAWFVALAAKLDGAPDVTYAVASIPLFLAFFLTCCFVGCVTFAKKILARLVCVRNRRQLPLPACAHITLRNHDVVS